MHREEIIWNEKHENSSSTHSTNMVYAIAADGEGERTKRSGDEGTRSDLSQFVCAVCTVQYKLTRRWTVVHGNIYNVNIMGWDPR